MKTDNIRIKRKISDFLLLGFVYLLMILFGIFLIGLPFLSFAPSGALARIVLVLLGIACLIAGGILYGLLLYRGIRPQDALIITNKGFTNKLVGGKEGVYVAWTDVASMRIFGMSKAPILGLVLENNDDYLSALDSRSQREARANAEDGLPVLTIAQNEVNVPIQELKNLFSRMIKGAISWENYTTQRKKSDAEKTENVTVESILQQAAELKKAKQPQDTQPPKTDKAAETAETLQSADLFRRTESKPSQDDPFQKVEQPSVEKGIFRKVEMSAEQKQSEPETDADARAYMEIAGQSEEPKAEEAKEPEAEPAMENEPVLHTEQSKDYPETKVFPAYNAEKKTDAKEDIVFFDMEDE